MEFQALGIVGVVAIGCLGVYTTYRVSVMTWRAVNSERPAVIAASTTLLIGMVTFLGGWMLADIVWAVSRIARAARRFRNGSHVGVT